MKRLDRGLVHGAGGGFLAEVGDWVDHDLFLSHVLGGVDQGLLL